MRAMSDVLVLEGPGPGLRQPVRACAALLVFKVNCLQIF